MSKEKFDLSNVGGKPSDWTVRDRPGVEGWSLTLKVVASISALLFLALGLFTNFLK